MITPMKRIETIRFNLVEKMRQPLPVEVYSIVEKLALHLALPTKTEYTDYACMMRCILDGNPLKDTDILWLWDDGEE